MTSMAKKKLPSLSRRSKPIIDVRQKITIFCEGRRTEPEYIKLFSEDHRNRLVEICVLGGIGVPKTIVQKAIEERRSGKKRSSFEMNDQIWVVFDRDDHKCIDEAFDLSRRHGFNVAYSNPCFELWAILHLQDHGKQINSAEAQKILKGIMPSYNKKGCKTFDYEAMKSGYENACRRAEALEKARIGDGSERGAPYTSVHKLMSVIAGNGKLR